MVNIDNVTQRTRRTISSLAVLTGSLALGLLPHMPNTIHSPHRRNLLAAPIVYARSFRRAASPRRSVRHLVADSASRASALMQQHRKWLAKLVAAEAGDQPYVEKLAVASVVLNRLKSPRFPHQWWAVLHQPGQFETVGDGAWAHARPTASDWQAARQAMTGHNPVPRALYFYNPALTTVDWMQALPGCQTIGAMQFCSG